MPPEPSRGAAWKVLAFLCALAFLNYMDRSLVFPLLAPIARDLGIAPGALGGLATAFDVVYACSAPLLGMASDRIERKRLLLVALVVWSLATGVTGAATGFGMLLLFRALTGLGEGGYFPTALSVIGDAFPARLRSRAIALHSVSATLGSSAGYAAGGLVGERWGWRTPLLLATVPGLVLAFAFWRGFVEPLRETRAPVSARSPRQLAVDRRPVVQIATSAPVLLTSLAACLAAFTMSGMATFLPLYLTEVHHLPVGQAGMLVGAVVAITIVGQLSGGTISDAVAARMPGGRPACVALGYVAVAPAALAMARAEGVAAVLVAYAAVQLLRGIAEPSLFGTVLDATAPAERGAAQGILIALSFVGSSAAGALVGGIIRARGFAIAFEVLAVVALIAASCAATLAVRLRREAAAA
jgi:predicted MFS family arabinose efflux permease